jgi:nucleoside-diphosphate-sugar epimerase
MKILVTGGAGFLGVSLVGTLLEAGFRVSVLDNLSSGKISSLLPFFRFQNFQFEFGDVRDQFRVNEILKGVDSIVHLAGIVGYPACDQYPALSQEVNVEGARVLEKARAADQQLIYACTESVYGQQSGFLCTEDSPTNTTTRYGIQKRTAEDIFLSGPKRTISLRFVAAYGISVAMRHDLLVHRLCGDAIANGRIEVYQPHFVRSFIHVNDMVRAIMHCIRNPDGLTGIFNCGSQGLVLSKRELCETISSLSGCELFESETGGDLDHRNHSISFKKLIATGYQTAHDLSEEIGKIVRYYKAYFSYKDLA